MRLTVSLLALVTIATSAVAADTPPNIIIIYADDLGYGDLGCYGHPTIRTPHLDKMAAEGMRFTQFYSAAEVCTPSRAALLTGRYPIRSGMCHDDVRVLRQNSTTGLPKDEITLAEALKERGYATGCVGKWHLGRPVEHLPPNHGFDSYFGMPFSNDMQPAPGSVKIGRDRFFQEKPELWHSPLIRGTEVENPKPDQSVLTKQYTDEAVAFIKEKKGAPFFLYIAHNFPHVPLFASKDFRGKSKAGLYGDVVEELDWSLGQVLAALKEAKVDDNTLVMFSSDNGPWLIFDQHGGSAGLLREGKGSTWEGGMRVPLIARWPAKIPAGIVQREVATTMDLFTTCVKISGAKPPSDRPIDGLDITPLLTNTGTVTRDVFLYYRGATLFAARVGAFKAHFITRSGYGPDKAQPHEPPLLFNLEDDPSEKFNVAAKHPQIIEQINAAVAKKVATIQPAPSQLGEPPKP